MSDIENGASEAQAQFESIKEMVEALPDWQAAAESEDWTGPHKDKYGATYFENSDGTTWACADWRELCLAQNIDEPDQEPARANALSVEVRSDWYTPGNLTAQEASSPTEYRILLCTGGPAVQIVGALNQWSEPESARLQHQDWFKPWTDWIGNSSAVENILLTYARCFYFGE